MLKCAKVISGFLLILLGFTYSYLWSSRSLNGERYILVDQLMAHQYRGLAAVKKELGINALTDHLLISNSPLNSLTLAKLNKTENFFQITLGHFSTKNKRGEPVFACQVYDKVLITYESFNEPSQDNSSKPPQTMVLEMNCKIAENDVKHLVPLNLAPGKILKETPADGIFPFNENGEFSVQFQNVEDQWAKQWVLLSVQFKDTRSQTPNTEIKALDLPEERRQVLNMDWSRIKE